MHQAQPKSEAESRKKREAFQQRTAGAPKASPAKRERGQQTGGVNAKSEAPGGGGGGGKEQKQSTPQGEIKASPLAGEVAAKLKESYGADLSDVVVRSGAGADAECAKRGCAAFALGGVITMSSKAGEPGTPGYDKILLHECAHIVQQRNGKGTKGAKDGHAKADARQPGADAGENSGAPGAAGAAPGQHAKAGAKGAAAPGAKDAKEKEADHAAAKAERGEKAAIKQKAGGAEAQHHGPVGGGAAPAAAGAAPAAKKEEGKHGDIHQISIPIGEGKNIIINPPNGDGEWQVGYANEIPLMGASAAEHMKKEVNKWWRMSIPTPFFGLVAKLGIQVGAELKVTPPTLKKIVVRKKNRGAGASAQPWYEIAGTVGTSLTMGGFAALTAGVSADVWIAEAGVGVKAKLGLEAEKSLEAEVAIGVNGTTMDWGLQGELAFKAWEMSLKGTIGLFAYHSTAFTSTYCKDWTLYERTLGKFSLAGIKVPFSATKGGGFHAGIEAAEPEVQGLDGSIGGLFPAKG